MRGPSGNAEEGHVSRRQDFCGLDPENYDRYMVPLIFESYARDMAVRAAALSPKAVLETAAGAAW